MVGRRGSRALKPEQQLKAVDIQTERRGIPSVTRSITVKEHSLVVMVVILVSDFLLSVCVSLPELLVHHLLDLQGGEEEQQEENPLTRVKQS